MKIEILDFGAVAENRLPQRAHPNDCGADVFAPYDWSISGGDTIKMALGFGLELPPGYMGSILHRGSMAQKGIMCAINPIDPSYTGEIHAVISNTGRDVYHIKKGDKIGQLVIIPCAIAEFVTSPLSQRGNNGYGSTGR